MIPESDLLCTQAAGTNHSGKYESATHWRTSPQSLGSRGRRGRLTDAGSNLRKSASRAAGVGLLSRMEREGRRRGNTDVGACARNPRDRVNVQPPRSVCWRQAPPVIRQACLCREPPPPGVPNFHTGQRASEGTPIPPTVRLRTDGPVLPGRLTAGHRLRPDVRLPQRPHVSDRQPSAVARNLF